MGAKCCSLVPLAKGGAAVGTSSLAQSEAEKDAQGEEEDGTQDPQTGEVILQDTHSVTGGGGGSITGRRQKEKCRFNWKKTAFTLV